MIRANHGAVKREMFLDKTSAKGNGHGGQNDSFIMRRIADQCI